MDYSIYCTPVKKSKVLIPDYIVNSGYLGDIYGFIHEDTGIYVITGDRESVSKESKAKLIGKIGQKKHVSKEGLIGVRNRAGLTFFFINKGVVKEVEIEVYSFLQNIFSRNKGLLETDYMSDKCAVLIGAGSVCSLVALQLARSGVGNFVLIDTDTMDIHNLCRHQCGFSDVGRFKVDAVADRILDINPLAKVVKFIKTIQTVTEEELVPYLGENSVLITGADNREADAWTSHIAYMSNTPFVSIGFWRRAFAGEVFYWLPGVHKSCYRCVLGRLKSGRVEQQRYYLDEQHLEQFNFEPGLSVDIDYGTTIGTKVILDVLNRNNKNYATKVIDVYDQYILTCNTNKESIGGEQAKMFERPLMSYSLKTVHSETCPDCGEKKKE